MANILYVSQGYNTHDRRFLDRLVQASHTVWFLPCTRDAVILEARPVPAGVQRLPPLIDGTRRWTWWHFIRAWSSFYRHLKQLRPDLVHAGPIQTGGFLTALSGFQPFLLMSWGSDLLVVPDRSRRLRWVTCFTLRRAASVLVDCEQARRRVMELSPLRQDQIVELPFGVELEQFEHVSQERPIRRSLNWQEAPVLIATRSLEPSHGVGTFLQAVREVLHIRPDVRVLMLGDGRLRSYVESFLREHQLQVKVHLVGQVPREQMPEYFLEADLYVSAAASDGTSVSLLEAMAAGLPAVVPDAFGNRDWIRPGENGWRYPAGNAQVLAQTILEALAQEEQRHRMGENNQALVRRRADWRSNSHKLLECYEQLIQKTGQNGARVHAQV